MLTKAQIQRMAQRDGVGMQVQERDYMQHLLLWLLYIRSQELIFKEGTALRLVYGGSRYSEDLDFSGPQDISPPQSLWGKVVDGLEDFGIGAELQGSECAWASGARVTSKDETRPSIICCDLGSLAPLIARTTYLDR